MQGNNLTIVANGTFVRGDLFSEDILVIEGGVEGNILGNRVIIKPTGWVHGDLSCRSLSIEPGGVVDGAVKVAAKPALPAGMAQPEALPQAEAYSLPGGDSEPEDDHPGQEADSPEDREIRADEEKTAPEQT